MMEESSEEKSLRQIEVHGVNPKVDDNTMFCLFEHKKHLGRQLSVTEVHINRDRAAALITYESKEEAEEMVSLRQVSLDGEQMTVRRADAESWKLTAVGVKGIPPHVSQEEITLHFENRRTWKRQLDVKYVLTDRSKGLTFVIFRTEQDALLAKAKGVLTLWGVELTMNGPHFPPMLNQGREGSLDGDGAIGCERAETTAIECNVDGTTPKILPTSGDREAWEMLSSDDHELPDQKIDTTFWLGDSASGSQGHVYRDGEDKCEEEETAQRENQHKEGSPVPEVYLTAEATVSSKVLPSSLQDRGEWKYNLKSQFPNFDIYEESTSKCWILSGTWNQLIQAHDILMDWHKEYLKIKRKPFEKSEVSQEKTLEDSMIYDGDLQEDWEVLPKPDNTTDQYKEDLNVRLQHLELDGDVTNKKSKGRIDQGKESSNPLGGKQPNITHMSGGARPKVKHYRQSVNKDSQSTKQNLASTVKDQHETYIYQTVMQNGTHIYIHTADITKLAVCAIVNAANECLEHGGGVALAIAKAAGKKFQNDSKKYVEKNGKIQLTQVAVLCAGKNLPCMHVINAVGPIWHEFKDKELAKTALMETFLNVFNCADQKCRVQSVAVPPISSGNFGVPIAVVASALFDALMDFDRSLTGDSILRKIHIVDINKSSLEVISKYFGKYMEMSPKFALKDLSEKQGEESKRYAERDNLLHAVIIKPEQNLKMDKRVEPSVDRQASIEKEWSDMSNLIKAEGIRKYSDVVVNGRNPMNNREKQPQSDWMTPSTHLTLHLDSLSSSSSEGPNSFAAGKVNRVETMNVDTPARRSREDVKSSKDGDSLEETMDVDPSGRGTEEEDESSEDRGSSGGNEAAVGRDQVSNIGQSLSSIDNETKSKVDDDCPICLEKFSSSGIIELMCKHKFHQICLDRAFKTSNLGPKCPVCGAIYGKIIGNQPQKGEMTFMKIKSALPGYEIYGTIKIDYYISGGTQTTEHPHPGKPYQGTRRTAYLPDCPEGNKVLGLLRQAFDARLIFTIGRSSTTGCDDTVVWNDIHHKTTTHGGQQGYGYPDPTYLNRVQEELAAKGIK